MVKRYIAIFLALIFFPFICFSDDNVQIHAELYPYNITENKPLPGTIEVTHDKNVEIDPSNFMMKGQPLSVTLVKNVQISPDNPLMVSIFSFELPPQPAGLRVLPEISLKAGNKTYKTFSSTFEVLSSSQAAPSPPPSTKPKEQPSPSKLEVTNQNIPGTLQLKAEVQGVKPLYPGQRLKFIYYYYYKGDIGLTKEDLPLLDAKGFLKVGEKEIKDYTQGEMSVREISQEVEAIKPGHFSFPPSIVEGLAYEVNEGETEYGKKNLKSEVPATSVDVEPFPSEGKPASFNGAVGEFTFEDALLSTSQIHVGDKIELSLKISGKTSDWTSLPPPELCCQPGFSGLFTLSDIPPKEEVKGNSKTFIVELRALSEEIKEIPSIEFSYFDPNKRKYIALQSKPIPITVKSNPKSASESLFNTPPANEPGTPAQLPDSPAKSSPIEILGNYPLDTSDLNNLFLGTWWTLWLLPFGAALIYLQLNLKREKEEQNAKIDVKGSQELFDEAIENPDPAAFHQKLKEALLLCLFERRDISSSDVPLEDLPNEGKAGKVKAFLSKIEESRYTGKQDFTVEDGKLRDEAKALFKDLQSKESI